MPCWKGWETGISGPNKAIGCSEAWLVVLLILSELLVVVVDPYVEVTALIDCSDCEIMGGVISLFVYEVLGYIIARPENHMLHHARGKHRANYSDLPVVDMLFGTFEVPKLPPDDVGFWNGTSKQVLEQFLCRNIVNDIRCD